MASTGLRNLHRVLRLPLLAALAGLLGSGCVVAGLGAAEVARIRQLEDREQILELLAAYGDTLDRRDFAAFGRLFAEDAEYGSGSGAPTRGRAAIQAQLERVMASNPSNLPTPNHHLFFNPSIQVDGDRATARSLGAYTAPDAASGSTRLVFFVWYQDELVRGAEGWLFRKRMIGSGAPPAPAR